MSLFLKDAEHIYRAVPLLALDWLEHGFGTRDTTAWESHPNLVSLRQVHSARCILADAPAAGCLGEGDALLTAAPRLLLSVRTADCVPLLLADERHRAVAAVHCGWRGTVARIAVKAVQEMGERFSSRPEDLHAAIGPAIGKCCYEVGPEVAVQFQAAFPERSDLSGRACIDLAEANRRQLLEVGIPAARIYSASLCTSCHSREFHSWRRDRETAGCMLSVIGIRG